MISKKNITYFVVMIYWAIPIIYFHFGDDLNINPYLFGRVGLFLIYPPFILGSLLGVLGGTFFEMIGHLISLGFIIKFIKKKTKLLD